MERRTLFSLYEWLLDKTHSYKSKARDIRRLLTKIGEDDPKAEELKKQMRKFELYVFFLCFRNL